MDLIPASKLPQGAIMSWCPSDLLEDGAKDQILKISDLPFTKYCALMPDAHQGMAMPIGGVVGLDSVIVPDFVGVDIGCGMCAVKTNLKEDKLDLGKKEELLERMEKNIPVGFAHNDDRRFAKLHDSYYDKYEYIYHEKSGVEKVEHTPFSISLIDAFFRQVGTLGGGNHFIEIQKDEESNIWVMIHSGSRNIGKTIGEFFNKIAKEMNTKYYSCVPSDIGFLPTDTEEGKSYLAWMDFALRFAFLNRQIMMKQVEVDMSAVFHGVEFGDLINIHHNYAALETHFGKHLWVHRKGATFAGKGTVGIIPGSMGTSSYIVEGLGETKSLLSCSHGAGRVAGRMDFNRKYNTEEGMRQINESLKSVVHSRFQRQMSRKHKEIGMMDFSEAPQAYKNIDQVMESQKDLVTIKTKLTPLVSMKG
jgi:tRNA-splicing ligase RtcB (3'-phosphate/5'-hydroxy nucleic acid ligase)